ncbi:MAG: hypothetical protein M1836_006981 [Candelina mexicana]|nr:MAG: hypothetical protein M1836_006981 [Candelina mexicana]
MASSNDTTAPSALQPVFPFELPFVQSTSDNFDPVRFTEQLDFRCHNYDILIDMRYIKLCLATQLWTKFPETMTPAIHAQYEQKLAHDGVTDYLNETYAIHGYPNIDTMTEQQRHSVLLTQTCQNQQIAEAIVTKARRVTSIQVPVSGYYEQEDHLYFRSLFQEVAIFVGNLIPVAQQVITATSTEAKAVAEHHARLSAKENREFVDRIAVKGINVVDHAGETSFKVIDHVRETSFKVVDYSFGKSMMLVDLFRLEGMKVVDRIFGNVVFLVFSSALILLGYNVLAKFLELLF